MKIKDLPVLPANSEIRRVNGVRATLNPLVFTGINDLPSNPRLGLGYHQLYDPTVPVGLIASLPDVTRVGDTICLYWDGDPVQTFDLDQPTIDKTWISFSVSPSKISEPEGTVYYTLYDNQADDLQSSDERIIKVDRRPPGGLDPDISTSFNDALALATIAPPTIDNPSTAVTVTVQPWVNMAVGDELTVLWNNIRVPHPPLQPGDVGLSQVVAIAQDVVEQGGSGIRLPVTYEIRDIVDNYSLLSPVAFASVDIDPNALTPPRVQEANQQTSVLDLAALGDNDAHAQIPHYAGALGNDQVTLTWTGYTANSQIELILGPETVGDPDFDPFPVFTIPNDHLKSIAGGSAVLSYEATRAGVSLPRSKQTAITLTGVSVPLAAPTVSQANGTVIDLATITGDNVQVVIAPYVGKKSGDAVSLIWAGTTQAGLPVNYTDDYIVGPGEESSDCVFNVDRMNLDPLGGGSLSVRYQVVFKETTSAVDLPASIYSVIGVELIKESFDGQAPQLIQQNNSLSAGKLTIRFVSGLGKAGFPPGDTLPTDPGPLTLPVLHVCFQNPLIDPGTQTLEIDPGVECSKIECDIHGLNGTTTVSLLDSGSNVIETISLPSQTLYHFSYTTRTQPIRRLRIMAIEDWTRWDNFVMTP